VRRSAASTAIRGDPTALPPSGALDSPDLHRPFTRVIPRETPARLLVIDRDEFLAAATGGAAARDAADDLVETRLAMAESPVETPTS
jgi:hypothetical protein